MTTHESAASDPTASSPTASGGGASGPGVAVQASETAPPVEAPNAGLHESDPTSALDGATSTPEPLVAGGAPDVGAHRTSRARPRLFSAHPEARPRAVRMASPRSHRRSVNPPRQPGNRRRANSRSSIRPWSREDSRSMPRPRRSSTRVEWLRPSLSRASKGSPSRHARSPAGHRHGLGDRASERRVTAGGRRCGNGARWARRIGGRVGGRLGGSSHDTRRGNPRNRDGTLPSASSPRRSQNRWQQSRHPSRKPSQP